MLLAALPPHYTTDTNLPKGYVFQHTQSGFVLLHHRSRKAKTQPWPAGSVTTGSIQHPFDSNRHFRQMLYHAWKQHLSGANRANWNAAGASVLILNHAGISKHMNGYQLFCWFETANQ